jgi:hypothetical protein
MNIVNSQLKINILSTKILILGAKGLLFMRLPLILFPIIPTQQFAYSVASLGGRSKILCASRRWMACLALCCCLVPPVAHAQNTNSVELQVELEPGNTFAEGWIIAAPRFSSNLTYPIVLDHLGNAFHNDLNPYRGFCFEQQPNGELSWFATQEGYWEVLDSSLQVTKVISFEGAGADFHDLVVQPNGKALVLGKEIIEVDVADSVPDPSNPLRSIIDCLIQEQDSLGTVLWSWRGSEHIPPTWCTHCNWSANLLDPYHHNAFQILEGGDILLCLRNMDLVVRIDKATGDLVWALGGPFSDFSFGASTEAFRHPHDAQLIEGNRLLLFDNGTGKPNPVSRGVEYVLDLNEGVVNQLQEWVHPDGNYASSQGSIQRLETGGTLISWGTANSEEYGGGLITEYASNGSLCGSICFPTNHFTYRARKVPLGGLPMRQGCREDLACNYDAAAVLDGLCEWPGTACDDGNPCTEGDVITGDCGCQGTAVDPESNAACSDPSALNFNPCTPSGVDIGACQYEVAFRADATAMAGLPETVTLLIEGNPYPLTQGGFGTWNGALLLGNGTWNYQFMADGVLDNVQRSFSLPWPLPNGLGEQRGCIGLAEAACPGCTDPDNAAFSPFATSDVLCDGGQALGCTAEDAENYSAIAIFDDGSCQFNSESSCPQDLDGDGIVGVADVLELLTYFGSFCP